MYAKFTIFLLLTSLLCYPSLARDDDAPYEIGIVEKLGEYVPLDIELIDEHGSTVTLEELIDGKPFVLSLVYYTCPGICTPLLNGMAEVVGQIDMEPSTDFRVITVSFDPDEVPILASEKKANYRAAAKREFPEDGWRFLTATAENIQRLTESVGFRYKQLEDGTYVHSGAIMAVAPDGMVARYLYGVTYLPFDLKMALVEASSGKVGPTINRFLLYCFSYETQGRQYTFNILRVVGTATTVFGLMFFIFLVMYTKAIRKSNDT